MNAQLLHGDCLERLKELPDNSVDSIVTDPPYGLSFMGKKWDYDVPSEDIWRECLRVLKPGGHLLAFAGTRTQHRMAVRIEDAGFEIRDMIAWVYGSGFPKSLDVSKAIDRAAGAEREVVGKKITGRALGGSNWRDGDAGGQEIVPVTVPATEAARQWQGWGTALKPALEPITMARKPLVGTVAANVLEHGTGALNIDGCRVGTEIIYQRQVQRIDGGAGIGAAAVGQKQAQSGMITTTVGRWPANLIHDGSEEVVGLFPVSVARPVKPENIGMSGTGNHTASEWTIGGKVTTGYYDTETNAARFFYCAKASKRDRDEGCEEMPLPGKDVRGDGGAQHTKGVQLARNHHPTVKPTALMRYLCRLVTPPGGTVLDPFMGSGSTGKAAMLEGFQFIGIEREAEYLEIAKARIEHAAKSVDPQLDMPGMV